MAFGIAETVKLAVDLSLKGNFVSALSSGKKALGSFDAAVTKSQGRAYRAGQQIGTSFLNVGKLIKAGAVTATGALLASIKVAGDFEAQLNTINTVALASEADLTKAGKGIRSLAKEYGTTFAPISDLTAAEYDLVSAGIKLQDSQAGLTTAVRLGIGAYGSSAEAVDVLTTAINAYNLKTKDGAVQTGAFTKLSDELAQAVADGKVKLSEIAAEYATVAPLAAAAGIGTDEIAAALGRVTATGSSAGATLTQMSRAIVELQKPTAELTKLQDKFHKNYAEIAKDKGLNVALEQIRDDAKKAGVPFIDLFGRIEAYKFALNTTGSNSAAFRAELDRVRHSVGALDKQVDERTKGLNFQLGRLKAQLQGALITLATPALPRITGLFERLNKAIDNPAAQASLERIADRIVGLFSDQNIKAGTDAIQGAFKIAKESAPTIAEAARITGSALKIAVDAFRSLPKELQTLAIAGLAVNKLTGGLVTNIAGGLIEAVVKRLVSAVVNVNGAVVNVNGGVGVGGPLAAAGGGGIRETLTALVSRAIPIIGGLVVAKVASDVVVDQFAPVQKSFLQNAQAQQALVDQGKAVWVDAKQVVADAAANQKKLLIGPPVPSRITVGGFDPKFRVSGFSDAGKDDRVNLTQLAAGTKAFLADLTRYFRKAEADLDKRKPKNAKSDVATILDFLVGKHRGNEDTTRGTLATLKAALSRTHDPQLARILRSAIEKVGNKLDYKVFMRQQLQKAQQIARGTDSSVSKISQLTRIQQHFIHNGDTITAGKITAQINRLRTASVYAQRQTTETIKDKDMRPRITIPINTRATTIINGRAFIGNINRQTILVSPGKFQF